MATDAAASARFRKVGGVTVEVQDHFTGAILDGAVWVGHRIIEGPNGCISIFFMLLNCWEAMAPMATSMVGLKAME